jgi:hypothetical protein
VSTEIRQSAPRAVVVTPTKSVGIQILLVVFLGPLGLFYSTIKGALIMIFGVPIALAALVAVTGLVGARGGAGVGTAVAVGSEILLTMLVIVRKAHANPCRGAPKGMPPCIWIS